ncbi:barstar family protein [Nocardia niigatensis]|uniref:barstar family protein n=1 Tax=Nocardia niigatensis TaxID=209249 RepID=UPI001461693C
MLSLDGSEMGDVDGVFEQYYREFEFPTYFGGNWPAFEECLTSLENLPARGYLTVIHNAERVLFEDRLDASAFLRILNDAGRYWSNALGVRRERDGRSVPFNTVFLSQRYEADELLLLLTPR